MDAIYSAGAILAVLATLAGLLAAAWRVYRAWDALTRRVAALVTRLDGYVSEQMLRQDEWRKATVERSDQIEARVAVIEAVLSRHMIGDGSGRPT